MTTFRDALTSKLADYDLGKLNDQTLKTSDITDDLLRMPEMRAIRKQFLTLVDDLIAGCNDPVNHGTHGTYTAEESRRWYLCDYLPEHVIDWVLS